MNYSEFEPVRTYIAALVGPVAAALIGFGVWDANKVNLLSGVVLAILAVPTAMIVRSKVTPVAKAGAADGIAVEVANRVETAVADNLKQLPAVVQDNISYAVNQLVPEAVAKTATVLAASTPPAQKMETSVFSPQPPPAPNPYA